jgi:hypothetical protein
MAGGEDAARRRCFSTTTMGDDVKDDPSSSATAALLIAQHVHARRAARAENLQAQVTRWRERGAAMTAETTESPPTTDNENKQRDEKEEILSLLDAWVEQWRLTRKSTVTIASSTAGAAMATATTRSSPSTTATDHEPISPAEMVNIVVRANESADDSNPSTRLTSFQTYGKLIDGIVEAAKSKQHKIAAGSLAHLAEATCLDPMIQLYHDHHVRDASRRSPPTHDDHDHAPRTTATSTTTLLLVQSFNKVMTLYCQEKKVPAAEQLLNRLEATVDDETRPMDEHDVMYQHDDGDHDDHNGRLRRHGRYKIPVSTYSIVIAGYAHCGMPREAEHILFARLVQKRKLMPTKDLFEVCLSAWEIARTIDAGQRAEFLILRHQQWHEAHPQQIAPPDAKTLARAVNAWVNSRHPEAATHIEKILETMYAVEFHDVSILANAHIQAMKLWAWKGDPQKCNASMAFFVAQVGKARIPPLALQRMYAARIDAYAKSKNTLQKQLRRVMAELEQEGSFGPLKYWDRSIYLALFDALARNGQGADAEFLLARMIRDANDPAAPQPNLKAYNSVILAWSRSSDPEAAHRAERVFLQMRTEARHRQQQQQQFRNERHNKSDGAEPILLDVVSYNAVLAAMARAPEKSTALAMRGESYLDEIYQAESFPEKKTHRLRGKTHDLGPTTVTFNQAILLWWRVSDAVDDEVIGRVDALLERMSWAGIPPDRNTLQACLSVVQAMELVAEGERERLIAKYNERFAMVRRNDANNKSGGRAKSTKVR